jgi:hypothetical protein
MTIRNIPDNVYDAIAKSAQAEHRSLQEQVRCLLENEATFLSGSVCEKAVEYRTRLAGRTAQKSVVEDLREDRLR